jgi:hypothetical protein
VYLPTHRKGLEVNEGYDRLRLKNYVQQIRAELQDQGLKSHQVAALLRPVEDLLDNWVFWRYQLEGLAVFGSHDFFAYYRSPLPFEENYQVGNRFLVKPLLPFAQPPRPYYLLKLGKNGVTLYKADRFNITEVDTEGLLPAGIEEVTRYYDFEQELQGRSAAGGGVAAMHRSDDMDNKHKDHLLADYFRMVDEGIRNLAGTDKAPLVLACVGYYQPIYRQVNSYPFLHESALTGNFDHAHPDELHREANALLGGYFQEGKHTQLERYRNSAGSGLVSGDLREILHASVSGRVDTLFLRPGAEAWGHFDEGHLTATLHDAYQEGDTSLVEQAALLTLQNGGRVYPLHADDALPGREASSLAALFRF